MRFVEGAGAVLRIVCNGIMLGMVGVVVASVLARAFLPLTIDFAEEVAGWGLAALTCLGVAISVTDGKLYRVDIVYDRLGPRMRAILDAGFLLAALGVTLVLTWQSYRLVASSIRKGVISTTSSQLPLYMPQSVLPLGFGILAVVLCWRLARTLSHLRTGPEGRRDG